MSEVYSVPLFFLSVWFIWTILYFAVQVMMWFVMRRFGSTVTLLSHVHESVRAPLGHIGFIEYDGDGVYFIHYLLAPILFVVMPIVLLVIEILSLTVSERWYVYRRKNENIMRRP